MTRPPWLRLLDSVSAALAIAAGVTIVGLSLLIGFDIVARSWFRFSVQGTDELGGYVLALVGSLGLPYALLKRGHPRIDLLLPYLPQPLVRVLHVAAYGALTWFAVFVADHSIRTLMEAFRFNTTANTPLQTPLWIPQLLWVVGTVAFACVALICTLHAAYLWWREPARLTALYGPPSPDDEIKDYLDRP